MFCFIILAECFLKFLPESLQTKMLESDTKVILSSYCCFCLLESSKPKINHQNLKKSFTATFAHTFDQTFNLIFCIYHLKKLSVFQVKSKLQQTYCSFLTILQSYIFENASSKFCLLFSVNETSNVSCRFKVRSGFPEPINIAFLSH